MTEETFIEILQGFKADTKPGWSGYMALSLAVDEAHESLGFIKTSEIMKQELGE